MSFKISRTTALWGLPQLKEVKRGKKNKVEGVVIPFSISGHKDLLDKVIPYDGKGKFSDYVFDKEDGRVLIPTASVNSLTKLEGMSIKVWDRKKPIELKETRLEEPKLELMSPNTVVFSSKILLVEPDDETMNRFRKMRGKRFDLELVAEQTDLFDKPGDEAEETDKKTVVPIDGRRRKPKGETEQPGAPA